MATPELRLERTKDGIVTVRETWQEEIARPDREKLERDPETQEYLRSLAAIYESKTAEVAALRYHARKLGEQTAILQRQAEEREREQAKVKAADVDVEQKFRRLADQWRNETLLSSSSTDKLSHPAYLKIIGMGSSATPLILREMEQQGGHWFLALRSITEADPVRPEDAGKIKKMAEAWIEWGRQNGYL